MSNKIYIITRQTFFSCFGAQIQFTDENPVVTVCKYLEHALDFLNGMTRGVRVGEETCEMLDYKSSTGLMYSLDFRNKNKAVTRSYKIICEEILP